MGTKLREIEVLGYIIEKKQVKAMDLVRDFGISLELASRWLNYLYGKGWLVKRTVEGMNNRFYFTLSPEAERALGQEKQADNFLSKVMLVGLGAILAMALSKNKKEKKG